jgi:hypothetical protein
MPFDESKRDPIYECCGCGIYHPEVECAGIFFCPNPLCPSCGAAYWRSKMKSFRDINGHKHTVDPEEMVEIGRERLKVEADEELRRGIEAGVLYWSGEDKEAFFRLRNRGGRFPSKGAPGEAVQRRLFFVAEELLEKDSGG